MLSCLIRRDQAGQPVRRETQPSVKAAMTGPHRLGGSKTGDPSGEQLQRSNPRKLDLVRRLRSIAALADK